MKKRLISALVVLVSLGMLVGAGFLLWTVMPQPKPENVTSLETDSVFGAEEQVVAPDREEAYDGQIVAPIVEPEAPTEAPAEPTPEPQSQQSDPHTAKAQEILDLLTPEEKVWQLFFATPEALTDVETATRAGDTTRAALHARPVGGVVYFSQNLEDAEQTREMLQNTQSYSKIPLFLATDEEGGRVSRIASNPEMGLTPMPAMITFGSSGDPAALYDALSVTTAAMKDLGFTMNFAPVADVSHSGDAVIADRAFGSDPAVCAAMVPVAVSAIQDGGLASCLKHFPGYGSAVVDDHNAASASQRTLEELEAEDFLPFIAGMEEDAAFVMVSHVAFPQVTGSNTPGDLSSRIVSDLLRNKLGFSNVIITDAQDMVAITETYGPGQAAVQAIQAGVDMILMPADLMQAYDTLMAAVNDGTISQTRIDESVLRILTVKSRFGLLPTPEQVLAANTAETTDE